MNCTDVGPLLPLLLTDDLAPEQRRAVAGHVAACTACAADLDDLRRVLGLLDASPAPQVRLDMAAIYGRAAQAQARRLRRWRRAATVCAGLAAAVLLLFLVRGLELRWEPHQMTLRWGQPPSAADSTPAPPPEKVVVHVVEKQPQAPTQPAALPPDAEKRLRDLDMLVHALVDDAQQRDALTQQEVARLKAELLTLRQLRQEDAARFAAVERDIRAMYNDKYLTSKGNGP